MNYKYKIAYLGQRQNEKFRSDIINIKGKDLTLEIVQKLNKMLDAGEIEAAPDLRHFNLGNIVWKDAEGSDHRPNNLPSKEWVYPDNNPGAYGSKEYTVHGKNHRTNGPAIIDSPNTIEWCVNGATLFCNQIGTDKSYIQVTSLEDYKNRIKQRFPEADADYWADHVKGDRIYSKDGEDIFKP